MTDQTTSNQVTLLNNLYPCEGVSHTVTTHLSQVVTSLCPNLLVPFYLLPLPVLQLQHNLLALIPGFTYIRNCQVDFMLSMEVSYNVGPAGPRQCACHGISLYHQVSQPRQLILWYIHAPVSSQTQTSCEERNLLHDPFQLLGRGDHARVDTVSQLVCEGGLVPLVLHPVSAPLGRSYGVPAWMLIVEHGWPHGVRQVHHSGYPNKTLENIG